MPSLLDARSAIENEMVRRGMAVPTQSEAAILDYVVGRTVGVVNGTPEIVQSILDYGYIARDFEDGEEYDTVVVVGTELLPEHEAQAKWSLVCWDADCTKYRVRGMSSHGQLMYSEKFRGAPPKRSHISFQATVVQRKKAGNGWQYRFGLLGSDGTHEFIWADAAEEYRNGTVVLVNAQGIIDNNDDSVFLKPVVTGRSTSELPDTWDSVRDDAIELGILYTPAKVYTVEEYVDLSGYDVPMDQARAVLRDFAGTPDEAAALMRQLAAQQETNLDVTQFRTDEQLHRVYGVVLEPYKPYGPNAIWFRPETIARIAAEFISNRTAALDHIDSNELKITDSFVIQEGMQMFDGVAVGSWIIGCEVDDSVYAEIRSGKYKGFSIKGEGILA